GGSSCNRSSSLAFGVLRVKVFEHCSHELVAVCVLAGFESSQTCIHTRTQLFNLSGAIAILSIEQAQSRANHLTCGIVAATPNLGMDHLLKLGRQRDVHAIVPAFIAKIPSRCGQCQSLASALGS